RSRNGADQMRVARAGRSKDIGADHSDQQPGGGEGQEEARPLVTRRKQGVEQDGGEQQRDPKGIDYVDRPGEIGGAENSMGEFPWLVTEEKKLVGGGKPVVPVEFAGQWHQHFERAE